MDNTDLIGRKYRYNSWTYEVTGIDPEYPSVIEYREVNGNASGCMLADFVRPHILIGEH